jgi:hypothetical protein
MAGTSAGRGSGRLDKLRSGTKVYPVLGAGFAIAGYVYHNGLVLKKMAHAFEPGDSVLDLAAVGKDLPPSPLTPATH